MRFWQFIPVLHLIPFGRTFLVPNVRYGPLFFTRGRILIRFQLHILSNRVSHDREMDSQAFFYDLVDQTASKKKTASRKDQQSAMFPERVHRCGLSQRHSGLASGLLGW